MYIFCLFFTCATIKTNIGKAADSSACSIQLASRLYWLLWGARGGLDRPANAKISLSILLTVVINNKILFLNHFFIQAAYYSLLGTLKNLSKIIELLEIFLDIIAYLDISRNIFFLDEIHGIGA